MNFGILLYTVFLVTFFSYCVFPQEYMLNNQKLKVELF